MQLGNYSLGQDVSDDDALVEFTPAEYLALLGVESPPVGQRVYSAPPILFLDRQWSLVVGVHFGQVFKLSAQHVSPGPADLKHVFEIAVRFCTSLYGLPASDISTADLRLWDTPFGNVIVDRHSGPGPFCTNVHVTSGARVRSAAAWRHTSKERAMSTVLRWDPSLHSDQDNLRWCWLRAVEWGRFPIFLSQPLAPLLLLLISWPVVIASAVMANLLWALIRYRFVDVTAASVGALLVMLRWVTWPGVTIYLFLSHSPNRWISLLWPVLIYPIGLLPTTRVGRIQVQFMRALGYEPTPENPLAEAS